MRYAALALGAATLTTGLGLAACTHAGEQVDQPTQAPVLVTQTVTMLPDCEDQDPPTAPCVTYDEGQWRQVDSYEPYSFQALAVCDAEDYPTNTPCVWKHKNAGNGKWMVYTR